MTDQPAAANEAPAPAVDMGAIWDKHQDATDVEPVALEEPKDEAPAEAATDAPEVKDEPKAEEQPKEAVAAVEDAPTELPGPIKTAWKDIPAEAREAIVASQREYGKKMADQGRVVQAAKPVYDVLVQAAQEIPSMQNMTPEAIAKDVFQMATISDKLNKDPVATLMGIAKEYGALDALGQRIGGLAPNEAAQQNVALVQEVQRLTKLVEQNADPSRIDARFDELSKARDVESSVREFAGGQEHWGAVESVLPNFIPIVQQRLGDGASPKDVLSQAYDMAIHADPDLRAKVAAAAPAPATPDPKRTEAQLKAKSVNVGSKPTGGATQMTERQQMAAIFDKYQT